MAFALPVTEFVLIIACRRKTRASETSERSLREEARSLPRGREVRWVGETPRIHEYLAASDLVVLPATSLFGKTDHPLVLLEAMAHGVPPVVSEAAPIVELVDSGGAVSCPAVGEALAECVSALLADSERRRQIGVRGREYVEREHAAVPVAARYEALYERVWRAR